MTRPIPTDWQPPTELRCIGGPADGKWFAMPPAGYTREETRGGAYWHWSKDPATLSYHDELLGITARFLRSVILPPSALPCESGPEPKP